MAQTAAGIRYPTTQDALAETDRFIRELDADATAALGKKPWVIKPMVATTDGNGNAPLVFPEFSTLQGCVVQYAHPTDYPVTVVLMGMAGNSATIQLAKIWRATSNAYGTPNTTAPFTGASVWVIAIAWGVPV